MTGRHLAVICDQFNPQDVTAVQATVLANAMAEQGYRVTVLARSVTENEVDPRVELLSPASVSRLPGLSLIQYRRWVIKTLARIQPDHSVSMLSTVHADIVVPVTGTVHARVQASMALHAGPTQRARQWLINLSPMTSLSLLLERRVLRSEMLIALIALSPRIEADLKAYGVGPGVVIHRADVSMPEQRIGTTQATAIRDRLARAWGLDTQAYWIVLPFDAVNAGLDGLESTVRAFKPLVDGGVNAVLLLAGQARYTHLAWIAQLGLRNRVRFVGKTARLEELMAGCDLIVAPTAYDPAGWAMRPAIASAKPIITTTASDAAQAVRQQGGTVLKAPVEPLELLEAIRQHVKSAPAAPPKADDEPPQPGQAPALVELIETLLQPR